MEYRVHFHSVIDGITDTYGKFPVNIGNVLILDAQWIGQLIENIVNSISPIPFVGPSASGTLEISRINFDVIYDDQTAKIMLTMIFQQYTAMIVIVFNGRQDLYKLSQQARRSAVYQLSDQIAEAIGINATIQYTDVINQALTVTSYLRIYMDEVDSRTQS